MATLPLALEVTVSKPPVVVRLKAPVALLTCTPVALLVPETPMPPLAVACCRLTVTSVPCWTLMPTALVPLTVSTPLFDSVSAPAVPPCATSKPLADAPDDEIVSEPELLRPTAPTLLVEAKPLTA